MKPQRQNMGCPSCVSGFCQRMQAALEQRLHAKSETDRIQAIQAMTALIRDNATGHSEPRDYKMAQSGEAEVR